MKGNALERERKDTNRLLKTEMLTLNQLEIVVPLSSQLADLLFFLYYSPSHVSF